MNGIRRFHYRCDQVNRVPRSFSFYLPSISRISYPLWLQSQLAPSVHCRFDRKVAHPNLDLLDFLLNWTATGVLPSVSELTIPACSKDTRLDSKASHTGARPHHRQRPAQVVGGDRDRNLTGPNTCSQLFLDDPYVSARHLRIYTVVYDDNDSTEVDSLVYAEDLSRNGTYWNGTLIGRGNHGFLLSDGDVLKLSINVSLKFTRSSPLDNAMPFDLVQENEMDVGHPEPF